MLESSVTSKHEFGNEEIIQSNLVPEGLLVASDCDEELPQTCGADTLFAKKDLASSSKKLKLSSHAVKLGWYMNCLFQ
jgi:hypothetical protein